MVYWILFFAQVHKTSGKESSRSGDGSDEKTNGMKATTTSSRSILGLDKPRQIFWEKRLSGLQPSYEEDQQLGEAEADDDDENMDADDDDSMRQRRLQQQSRPPPFKMPAHFKPVGPGVDTDILLASISTSIHLGSGTIRGQTAAKVRLAIAGFFGDVFPQSRPTRAGGFLSVWQICLSFFRVSSVFPLKICLFFKI